MDIGQLLEGTVLTQVVHYFVEICEFTICGLIQENCGFAICGLADLRNGEFAIAE
jgi:hypothetical protein